jgi:hypothetical protein
VNNTAAIGDVEKQKQQVVAAVNNTTERVCPGRGGELVAAGARGEGGATRREGLAVGGAQRGEAVGAGAAQGAPCESSITGEGIAARAMSTDRLRADVA